MKVTVPKKGQFSLFMSYGILAFIFFVDLSIPLGIFGGVPYVIGMIVIMWLLKPHEILTFGVFCGILALGGYFSEDIAVGMEGLMNRFMAVFTIVAIALLVRRHTSLEGGYKEQHSHLTSVIDKRTEGLKQVVERLDEYKIRLGEAEELGYFGFWEYSPETQQMNWSNGVFSIYGYPVSPQPPSMHEFLDQCHVDDLEMLQRSMQYGIAEKQSYVVEYRLVLPDGTLKWIYNRGRPIVNNEGNVELLVGTIQDITHQKQSEEAVEESRARYTTLFNSASVAKALMIPNKKMLEVNQAFCDWIGYSEEELLRIPIERLMHRDDRSMEDAYAGDLMTGQLDYFQREKRFIRKDGEILHALFSVSAVFDAAGKVSCFAVEIVDLTRRKQAEEALNKAETAWHEAEEALTESEVARRLAENALNEGHTSPQIPVATDPLPTTPQAEEQIVAKEALEEPPVSEPLYITHAIEEAPPDPSRKEVFGEDNFLEEAYEDVQDVYEDSPAVREIYADPETYQEETEPVLEVDTPKEVRPAYSQQRRSKDMNFEMAEEVIDQLFQVSDGLMAVIGEDGFYIRLSPALNKALGYQEGVLEDQNFLDFVHEDDLVATEDLLNRLFAGKSIDKARFRHRCHDASFEWFTWNATFNLEHKVIYSVFYQASKEKVGPQSNRDSLIDWRRLTDKMPFQVWMTDTSRLCRYANKKVRDFTGLPFEQLEGTGWSKTIHPEHYRGYKEYCKKHFDAQNPMQYSYKLRRNDGSYRWMQETSVPLFDQEQTFEGYLATCMDISNLRAIQHSFKAALEGGLDLEDLTSVLQRCRRDECRHALTDSVKIADALIEYGREVSHPQLALLMEKAGGQLLGLVDDMLGFSNFEMENRNVHVRSVSLQKQVDSVTEMLIPLLREGGSRFQINNPDEEVFVEGDQVLMHRVLESIMRHLIERADSRIVSIDIESQNRYGSITFRHIGEIIDPSFFSRMPDLYRDKGSRLPLQEKAGLEFSLSKRLVEMMGGTFSILRERDIGPVLHIQFPVKEHKLVSKEKPSGDTKQDRTRTAPKGRPVRIQEVVAAIENMSKNDVSSRDKPARESRQKPGKDKEKILIQPEQPPNGATKSRSRVLVGEMSLETQRLVRSLLQPYHDLIFVSDTDELLASADKEKFDLLLLDVHLQGSFSGKDVLRELRKRPQYYRTPAIAVATGTSAIDQRDLIDRAGFDGFLRKPFSIVELLETVERLIEVV